MDAKLIKHINKKCTNEQGIFTEPYGVEFVKEPVIYMRWKSGGYSGGNCWDDTEPHHYSNNDIPQFEVLDLVLQELMPSISYLQHKQISKLEHSTDKNEWEYYGNSSEYEIRYIILSELETLINTLNCH